MPPRIASLTELLNSLDAATYFFVSSGIFIGVAAVLFFFLGLWLGGLIWAHYKRRFRHAEQAIEAFKGEVALLKRRLAEQSTRPPPTMGPSPLQSITFGAAAPKAGDPAGVPAVPLPPPAAFRAGAPFTVWTEAGWTPAEPAHIPLLTAVGASTAAVTIAGHEAHLTVPTETTADLPEWRLQWAPAEVLMAPRSRAFSVWTEAGWSLPVIKTVLLPRALGFSLWTQRDFTPACRGPLFRSRAFSLWTASGWTSPYRTGPPTRAARPFTLWTAPDWKSRWDAPPSKAFTVWTEPSWAPRPVKPAPLPSGAGWSVWTAPDFIAPCRGVLLPSRAFTLWTHPHGPETQPLLPQRHVGRPFTVWTESADVAAGASVTPRLLVMSSTGEPVIVAAKVVAAKKLGFVARARAAARRALGLRGDDSTGADQDASTSSAVPKAKAQSPVPKNAGQGTAVVTVKSAPVPTRDLEREPDTTIAAVPPAAKEESAPHFSVAPVFSGPLPPSKAFTIWTSGPPSKSGTRNKQSVAADPLSETRTRESTRGKASAHSPGIPPVPIVQSPDASAGTPKPGAFLSTPLDLEPLDMPGEKPRQ